MSLADSEAAFEQHCKRVDDTDFLFNLLKGQQIKNLSALAFAVGTPQSQPSDEAFKEFATNLNSGVDLSFEALAGLRRLHFEASAIVIAELKSRVTSDAASDVVRKLPVAEKAARLRDQEKRLKGLSLKGELQPSHALVDLCAQIKDTSCISWIPPSKCTKRDAEIQHTVKDKPVTLSLEQQLVKVTAGEQPIQADASTDLQLQWALQRRGLAFDQCTLMTYHEHEVWVQQLLGQLTREAPAGYSRVSTSQLIRADRELFTIMAQEIQGSVQMDGAGLLPMEESLKSLRTDPRVTMHLLPLPRGAAREVEKTSTSAEKNQNDTTTTRDVKKRKVSAKAKALCPEELKQFGQKDDKGRAICWAFNMKSGCKETVKDGRCKKGTHCCIKCHRRNHSLVTCRSAGN